MEAIPQPGGWQADNRLFEEVSGAAFAAWLPCRDVALTLLVKDAVTTARLVEPACGAIIKLLNLIG
ncbi:hypothetical protein [Kitasatospora sp. NPDC004272]